MGGYGDLPCQPMISVVIPAYNEGENLGDLLREIKKVLEEMALEDWEIIVVDDASEDNTPVVLSRIRKEIPQVRVLRHKRRFGQSLALWSGISSARGKIVVTMDGDGQNDPADLPGVLARFWEETRGGDLVMVVGNRIRRRDGWSRRLSSGFARLVRRILFGDETPDVGCGLKVFPRELYLQLPFFDHMHRFITVLVRRAGARVVSVEVNHRPRRRGKSKYGILGRALSGVIDVFGVWWLLRRWIRPEYEEV